MTSVVVFQSVSQCSVHPVHVGGRVGESDKASLGDRGAPET